MVELLGLGTPAGAFVAAESHLRILVKNQELAVDFKAGSMTAIAAVNTD
jgi:hypothetical protein